MGKLKVILTADYEIFGNGTGCVDCCMINPANRMMDICEQFNTELIFFADVCEIWSFRKAFEEGKLKDDWATKIESQMKEMLQRGHNVQLHLHPQWLGAEYLPEAKNWELNYQFWRLPEVEKANGIDGINSVSDLIGKGKKYLEDLFSESIDYKCNWFRAGAWSIQPDRVVTNALIQHGFEYDTSVAPGIVQETALTKFDFSKAPQDKEEYQIGSSVTQMGESLLTERPIYTTKVSAVKNAYFTWLKRKIAAKPKNCKSGIEPEFEKLMPKESKTKKLGRILQTQFKQLNSCDATSAQEMIYIYENARLDFREQLKTKDVNIIMIGHPKTFGNDLELEKFLAKIN